MHISTPQTPPNQGINRKKNCGHGIILLTRDCKAIPEASESDSTPLVCCCTALYKTALGSSEFHANVALKYLCIQSGSKFPVPEAL